MTTAFAALVEDAPSRRATRQLPGWVEFLIVGGATPLLFPAAWAVRRALGADESEYIVSFIFFYAAYVINDPHFAVTYLLFYRDVKRRVTGQVWGTAQRARYLFAGFAVPLVLAVYAGAALAVRSAVVLGWLVQLMFFLVGWHYTKQGFGVLSVLSARRGVVLTASERRIFLGHALATWAYSWASPVDPGSQMEERGVVYTTIPHGAWLEHVTLALFLVSTALAIFALGARLRSKQPFFPLGALTGYLCAGWMWTLYSRIDPLVLYAIPALHSIQYLYFVSLLKRGEVARAPAEPFAARSARVRIVVFALSTLALAWVLFHGAPDTLDAALFVPRGGVSDPNLLGDLGATPCLAAFLVCVNIHHYFMDHVIWRRENPDMALLKTQSGS